MSHVQENKENLSDSLTSMDWLQMLNADNINIEEPEAKPKESKSTKIDFCRPPYR